MEETKIGYQTKTVLRYNQPRITTLFTRDEVEAAVKRLAAEIGHDYHDKYPIIIGILKGSFIFMADLVRLFNFPLEVEFLRVSSYGGSTKTSGRIKLAQGINKSKIKDRHVLVIEDIIDTGLTTAFVLDYLGKKKPASLKLCALTEKPARRNIAIGIDYLGLKVPDKFIVGYGIDWNERFRHLPVICSIEGEDS